MASGNCNGFFAFLGGAVVGAVAALLLAPEKGENARARVRRSIQDYTDRVDTAVFLSEDDIDEMVVDEQLDELKAADQVAKEAIDEEMKAPGSKKA